MVKKKIQKFLRHVKQFKLRNRFNLFISDTQREHLEKVAKQNNVSKSDYVRKLIEGDINKW